jgi:hypothetical protein
MHVKQQALWLSGTTANGWPLHGIWPAHVQTGLVYPCILHGTTQTNASKVGVVCGLWSVGGVFHFAV